MIKKYVLCDDIGCKVTEIGKIVANKCLDKRIPLNTLKLEKLLILMQVEYIKETGKALFNETIIVSNDSFIRIKEIEECFFMYNIGMDMIPDDTRFCECITLLTVQEEIVDLIINLYGYLDFFELDETVDIQLIHKIAEEFNTQNIQSPLIFYGLERFSKDLENRPNTEKPYCRRIFRKKEISR